MLFRSLSETKKSELGMFTPIKRSIPTLAVSKEAVPSKEKLLLTTNGVTITSCDVRDLKALIHQKSNLTLTKASLVKSFLSGFDSLATANNSLLSLYIPIEVIYV